MWISAPFLPYFEVKIWISCAKIQISNSGQKMDFCPSVYNREEYNSIYLVQIDD